MKYAAFLTLLIVIVAISINLGKSPLSASEESPHPTTAYQLEQLAISDVWTTPSLGNNPNGAAYLTLTNKGEHNIRLVAASSTRAERVEIHTHLMENGVMSMTKLPHITIAANAKQTFAPGGLHIMLFGIKDPLHEGEKLPLTLTFDTVGTISIEANVKPLAAKLRKH